MFRGDHSPAAFYLALAANFFFFASFQWTFVTLPGYVQQLGGQAAQIGLAIGLATLSAVLVRPGVGPLVDRWGRKRLLLAGAGLFALEPILYLLTPGVWPFLAVRLLRGLGLAAFTTAYTALVADLAPPAQRGEALGLAGVTNNLGLLFAPTLGALVQARWGYPAHFLSAAAIGAASFLTLLPLPASRSQAEPAVKRIGLWTVARLRAVQAAALGSTGLAVAYGAVLGFLSPLAADRQLTAAGSYFTTFALTMMVCQAVAGWLSDRVGRQAIAVPGLIVAGLATAGLPLARTDTALLTCGAGLGLSWGLVRVGLDTAVVDAVPAEGRGSALGFLYTCFDAGIGVGAFGLGIIAQAQGYAATFVVAASWAAVALAVFVCRRERKER